MIATCISRLKDKNGSKVRFQGSFPIVYSKTRQPQKQQRRFSLRSRAIFLCEDQSSRINYPQDCIFRERHRADNRSIKTANHRSRLNGSRTQIIYKFILFFMTKLEINFSAVSNKLALSLF